MSAFSLVLSKTLSHTPPFPLRLSGWWQQGHMWEGCTPAIHCVIVSDCFGPVNPSWL